MSRKIIPIAAEGVGEPMMGKPSWLKVKAPTSPEYKKLAALMREQKLNTVCEEASCPDTPVIKIYM